MKTELTTHLPRYRSLEENKEWPVLAFYRPPYVSETIVVLIPRPEGDLKGQASYVVHNSAREHEYRHRVGALVYIHNPKCFHLLPPGEQVMLMNEGND